MFAALKVIETLFCCLFYRIMTLVTLGDGLISLQETHDSFMTRKINTHNDRNTNHTHTLVQIHKLKYLIRQPVITTYLHFWFLLKK